MKWIMSDFPVRNENGGMETIRSFSCSNCHYVVPAIHNECPGCGEEADEGTDFVVAWGKWNSNPLGDSTRKENAVSTEHVYQKARVIDILRNVIMNTYVCNMCGRVIFPFVTFNDENGMVEIERQDNSAYAGLGNKLVMKDICNNCIDEIR